MLRAIKHIIWLCIVGFSILKVSAQNEVYLQKIHLVYEPSQKSIFVKQSILIDRKSFKQQDSLVFLNWANAYKNKHTDLAKSFIENYDLNFHFAHPKYRGEVILNNVLVNQNKAVIKALQPDIFSLKLPASDLQSDTIQISFDYLIKLPHAKFTGYGIDESGDILLKNFFFQPVFSSHQIYTDKNIDDYPSKPIMYKVSFSNFPQNKQFISNLKTHDHLAAGIAKTPLLLWTEQAYEQLQLNGQPILWPLNLNISATDKTRVLRQIQQLWLESFGSLPSGKIVITTADFEHHKVYGLDLLPKILRPYKPDFVWELALLHQIALKYAEAMQIDRRKYPWLVDGLAAFFEYQYLKTYHPNQKLLGKLAQKRLFKWYYASQVKLTEKYPWLYLYVARMNKDQALKTALDSLTNYNRNVTMPFKTALGLKMLKDRLGDSLFYAKSYAFYQQALTQPITPSVFYKIMVPLSEQTWFKTFVNTNAKYDYKLKKVKVRDQDTLDVVIRNKSTAGIPLTIYSIKNDSLTQQKTLPPFKKDTVISLSNHLKPDFVGFNYFNDYPELQIKNNYKRPGFHFFEKPLQIRLFQDFDTPLKSQIFLNPFFEYNYYNGFIVGTQIFNESVLHNHLKYIITPGYGTKNNTLTGSLALIYTYYFDKPRLYAFRTGFSFQYFNYNHNLVYRKYNPMLSLKWRDPYLRNRKAKSLSLQYMLIDKEPVGPEPLESDRYGVLDLKFSNHNINVIKDFFYMADIQIARNFSKTSAMWRYRFLSDRNRQWDFRVFMGKFLFNQTQTDYFSFALDRPTDYLFQYNYYGRSETTGIFHQQFIWAEGGFKTFFDDQLANDYLISNNLNIGIWKWFNLYGDWAWTKNKNEPVRFYYDSGLRINVVQDYFEIFFPVYSKLGWEIKQPDYLSRIRMVFTLDTDGLFKMLKRGWY